MDDEGIFEVSSSAVNDQDICSDSCVVNDWLTHDEGDRNDIDVTQPSVNTSVLLPTTRLTLAVAESPVKQEILNTAPFSHTVPTSLDFTSLIVDMVHQYAAQVCVS